jgi:hypothetical protein
MSNAVILSENRRPMRRPVTMAPLEPRRVVIRLWLPLTPLWLVLAPFALVAAPALRLTPRTRRLPALRSAWTVGRLLLALSGTQVEVDTPAAFIRIHIL